MTPAERADAERIGRLLKEARLARSLSQEGLAAHVGLSRSTIKNVERGCRTAQATMVRLAEVLAVDVRQMILGAPPVATHLNCWLSESMDPLQMTQRLQQVLSGAGGQLDQGCLYFDNLGAMAWKRLAALPEYCRARDLLPLRAVADAIAAQCPTLPLDLIGLGCGDAAAEIRLTRYLRAIRGQAQLQLLDISLPLLGHAHATACAALGDGVEAHCGSFHDLPVYSHLLPSPGRTRVLCMFGGTFGNLENEILWVKSTLAGYAPGDMLLLDVAKVRAPADQPDQIRAADLRMRIGLPPVEREFLIGPIVHYGGFPADEIELRPELDTSCCPVPGSYGVRQVARVRGRRFGAALIKRYEPRLLGEALEWLGWKPVDLFEEPQDALVLLRKV